MDTNGREDRDEPQMNPPSREAMAGKLQIYADDPAIKVRSLMEPRSGEIF